MPDVDVLASTSAAVHPLLCSQSSTTFRNACYIFSLIYIVHYTLQQIYHRFEFQGTAVEFPLLMQKVVD